jgi:ATP/maltotriose-dependent transcriptional regulator MalT
MPLLERDAELASITYTFKRARASGGSFVFVAGESGIGKTGLMRAFADAVAPDARIAWGACDPLHTPRPLGPLHDAADELGDRVRTLLDRGAFVHEVCIAVFDALAEAPCALVVDDLHWADGGTLDVLRFLLRRVGELPSIVIATYRDDELGAGHPLRALLGDAARSPLALTLALRPLSVDAVGALSAARPVDAAQLHALTGGNPFFVAEVLEHAGDDLPGSVRDAVLARIAHLDDEARELLELLACAPDAVPDRALAVLGAGLRPLRTLDETGLVEHGRRGIAFRHELARLAVVSALPPGGAAALHIRMLDALEALGGVDAAILAHHALAADDAPRVLEHASRAGLAASRAGAHTQAAEFFGLALRHGALATPQHRAELLELEANELYLTDRLSDAIRACEQAMALREQVGDRGAMSADHHALSVYYWYNANRSTAERHASTAVEVVGAGADLPRLGHGYAMEAYLALHNSDLERARRFHARARDIAQEAGDRQLTARVEIIDAAIAITDGDVTGRERILSLIERDAEYFDDLYSAGYSNVAYLDVEQRRFQAAADVLAISVPLTYERDIPICNVWQLGVRARLALLRGDWDAAVADADEVLGGSAVPLARTWPYLVRGLVALRRGADGARADLDAGWELARRYGEPLRLLPAVAALAEQAWLHGVDDSRLDEPAARLRELGRADGVAWSVGELASWLHRLGREPDLEGVELAEPHRLLLTGRAVEAAAAWEAVAAPYDRALALADADEPSGLGLLDRLDADAVAARVRRDLRARGVSDVPGRPRRATRANPAGLTARQVEVLALIEEGLTNAEVAARLFISPKTADHHVSAILTKLRVRSRREAAEAARRMGATG